MRNMHVGGMCPGRGRFGIIRREWLSDQVRAPGCWVGAGPQRAASRVGAHASNALDGQTTRARREFAVVRGWRGHGPRVGRPAWRSRCCCRVPAPQRPHSFASRSTDHAPHPRFGRATYTPISRSPARPRHARRPPLYPPPPCSTDASTAGGGRHGGRNGALPYQRPASRTTSSPKPMRRHV
jgi:hypothetical protein